MINRKCSKCKTFDQLFLTKVIKIDATRCLDFSSKCNKMRLAAGLCLDLLRELTALPRPRLLVKCGIVACGMRKVKCGMECAESYCGTMGNMRNAESCPVGGRMCFNMGCRGGGGVGV